VTRDDLCRSACDGLSDIELRVVAGGGGFKHVLDGLEQFKRLKHLTDLCQELPAQLASVKGDLVKLRPTLIQMLAEIEEL
jgi:hypothetical protein